MVCVILVKPKDVAYILLLLCWILIVDSSMKLVWNKPKIGFQDITFNITFNIIASINKKYTILNVFYILCKITRDCQIRLKWW